MKTKKDNSMAPAIFAGIVAGSLVALRGGTSIVSLLVGAAVGALVGYLSVDLRQSWNGLVYGVGRGAEYLRHTLSNYPAVSWRRVWRGVYIALASLSVVGAWTPVYYGIVVSMPEVPPVGLAQHAVAYTMFTIMALCCAAVFSIAAEDIWVKKSWTPLFSNKVSCGRVAFILSPFGMICSVTLLCIRMVWHCSADCWWISKAACKGVRATFLYIHSERRVQASTYSIVGTTCMWWIQASVPLIIIGAVAGAILGDVLYRTVSVRFVRPPTV